MATAIPAFAQAPWYSDPSDHRCPHDSWLESYHVSEPATGSRSEIRRTAIELRLLGAYHDGHVVLRYYGVSNYSLVSKDAESGVGDWLSDTFAKGTKGGILHEIRWQRALWRIEAESITYDWCPIS